MPISDIAQLLDLGFTGGLIAAVVALWFELKANRAELVKVLREVAGLKAQMMPELEERFLEVWTDENGKRCGKALNQSEYYKRQFGEKKPYQYRVMCANRMYNLITTDTALMGLEYGQACELALYLEIPF